VSEDGAGRGEETTPRVLPLQPSVRSVPGHPDEATPNGFRHERAEDRAQELAVSPGHNPRRELRSQTRPA